MSPGFDALLYRAEGGRGPVRGAIDADGALLIDDGSLGLRRFEPGSFKVSERVGDTLRRFALADGALVESPDNAAIDAMLAAGAPRFGRWRDRLERSALVAVAAVLILASIAFGVLRYGVPAAAERIAPRVPDQALEVMSQQALDLLDRTMLKPSALTTTRRNEVAALFDETVTAAAVRLPTDEYRLLFRNGGRLGANAFALPNGAIVVTDELIALSQHPAELMAVFAHEIGHVEGHHAIRRLLQSGAMALVLLSLSGDVSMVSQLGIVLPGLLVDAVYSREFEREADEHAIGALRLLKLDPVHFVHILNRLEAQCDGKCGSGWLASHPSTVDRIDAITRR